MFQRITTNQITPIRLLLKTIEPTCKEITIKKSITFEPLIP